MEVTYLGHACFRIRTYVAPFGWVTIVTDPYDPGMVGLKFPRVEADIVVISHEHRDHNALGEIKNGEGAKILRGPGEYEIKGITIRGIQTWHDEKKGLERGENTVYTIESEGVKIIHLGDLGHKLTDSELAQIGAVDIVLVPVGGFYTIDSEVAGEVVSQLEPKVVLPMHYKIDGMGPTFEKLSGVGEFIKEMGIEPKKMDKFEVKKGGFSDEMELVILDSKTEKRKN